ncbi:hypothetical protein Tco_1296691, partial [Tanacetum coccineum]
MSVKQLYWSSTPTLSENVSTPTKVFPKKLISTNQVLKNLENARDLLMKFDECIKRRTNLSPHEIGSWEQSGIKGAFKKDVIPLSENLKETFKFFEKGFISEVKEMKDIFEQMKDEVEQCFVAKKYFEIEKKQLLINNDRLLEENISCDIMCTYLRSLNEVDNCRKCKILDIVLLDIQESNKSLCELRKHFAKLKEYGISLDIAFQNHKEKLNNDSRTNNNNHLVQAINNQYFKINDLKIVEIVLWYLDYGCSKHMTGHHDKLINFVSKFIGMVRFGNDHFAAIMGYGDLLMGNILISRVYYVEGLGHNLFSVGQFCDLDLEFLRTKDEAPEIIIKFLKQDQ